MVKCIACNDLTIKDDCKMMNIPRKRETGCCRACTRLISNMGNAKKYVDITPTGGITSEVTLTFTSDKSNTGRGFRIAFADFDGEYV